MARRAKPWYRRDRRSWFVSLDGVRHNLGPDKRVAFDRFHAMMTRPVKRRLASDAVVVIIDAFLEWCSLHRAADTYAWYRDRLQQFAAAYPDLTIRDLRPFHVQEWLDRMNGLASGSNRNYCRAVKRVLRWAVQQGYIDHNPIAHLEQPKSGKREAVLSQAEFDRLVSLVPSCEFRDLLIVTWETGCRPQESLRVEARHVDVKSMRWVFPETEGKGEMGRVVYLTDKAAEITQRLMTRSPSGKLFRNSTGEPWTTDAVNCGFIRIQQKMGLQVLRDGEHEPTEEEIQELIPKLAKTCSVKGEVVSKSDRALYIEARRKLRLRHAERVATKHSLYVLRHSWATHALERGVDALTVAILMGHRDPSTLAKVYQHLAHNPQYLLEQARKAVG